jgi:hypothetical protein
LPRLRRLKIAVEGGYRVVDESCRRLEVEVRDRVEDRFFEAAHGVDGLPLDRRDAASTVTVDEAHDSLALLLDIDGIRAALGRWEVVEESKLAARTLALVMAEAHLRGGHDVVIPQYVGRVDFIAMLKDVARRCGASFIEVLIDAPAIVAVDRFRARRRELFGRGELHPQAEVPDAAVEAAVDDARGMLEAVGAALKEVIYIRANQRFEDTYADLLAAIGDQRR